jgi:nitrate/TMAO reductase-like tetraheme cytochrome c subunit
MKPIYALLLPALFAVLLILGATEPIVIRASERNSEAPAVQPDRTADKFFGSLDEFAGAVEPDPSYAGSAACQDCHQAIYERFNKYSKKARTREQLEKMLPKLTGEEQKTCFQCHATGYGQQGGFVSYAQTPHLGDIGCEACHGPGSVHIQRHKQGDVQTEMIKGRPGLQNCISCHTPERGGDPAAVRMFSGAH